jgi:hypothetical protein
LDGLRYANVDLSTDPRVRGRVTNLPRRKIRLHGPIGHGLLFAETAVQKVRRQCRESSILNVECSKRSVTAIHKTRWLKVYNALKSLDITVYAHSCLENVRIGK